MDNVKDIHTKIDSVKDDLNTVKVGMVEIKTILESSLIKRIETLENKQKDYEEEQKTKNRWILLTLIPMLLKMIYDLTITVG